MLTILRSTFSCKLLIVKRPVRDLNPCYSLERAVSWTGLDERDIPQNTNPNSTHKSESLSQKICRTCAVVARGMHDKAFEGGANVVERDAGDQRDRFRGCGLQHSDIIRIDNAR